MTIAADSVKAAAPRGDYAVNEHLASPADVAKRYGTNVNWESIGNSVGLTAQQARHAADAAGCMVAVSADPPSRGACSVVEKAVRGDFRVWINAKGAFLRTSLYDMADLLIRSHPSGLVD